MNEKDEKKKKKGTEEKRSKALRKGSIPSTAQVHDFSYQNGREFANLSHRFSEKC